MSKKIKTLCIISGYPSKHNPVYPFVDQLVCQLADYGVNCIVISPLSVTKCIMRCSKILPKINIRKTGKGNVITVYRPRYLSFSYKVLGVNTALLTYKNYRKCVIREVRKRKIAPDAIYGHFIALSGMSAAEIGEIEGVPTFLAYGESSPVNYAAFKHSYVANILSKLQGVIAVSTENGRQLVDMGLIKDPGIIRVFPNGIDDTKFYKVDKSIIRKELGIAEDAFIVAFVGSFIERKGVSILSSALDMLEGVKSFFIGRGKRQPDCKGILFKGSLPHEEIYKYLNAADVFVLPTLAEGCCNAIIEAMACGLPIISSDLPFNYDILSSDNSILVDPKNVNDISHAIALLRDDIELRDKLGEGAYKRAQSLNIRNRARNILEFMEAQI